MTAPQSNSPSVISGLSDRIEKTHRKVHLPKSSSFEEFLLDHARVKHSEGRYGPYTFEGRECLREIVQTIDLILGSKTGQPLKDAQLDICGGAQFGKTILALNLGVYTTSVLFRNWGYYLPDDDLVEGVVDQKFRPDVIDQMDWLAECIQVGKTLNKSGRAVNKKGSFLITDGERTAGGMIRGMGKIPTSFSMDVVTEDEKDDIDPAKSKYLKGRMTASNLRFKISIGTQRFHGAGQNKQFEDGSQHVMMLTNPKTGRQWNPEENFPQILRIAVDGAPKSTDPRLTFDGDFKLPGSNETAAVYHPEATYYLADPEDGTPLDRSSVTWFARRPDRIKLRKWSFRVSQLGIAAIDLSQIVSAWQDAVKDSEDMIVFCCDRLAIPKSSAQALTPAILDRSHRLEQFDLSLSITPGCRGFAGLDMGDRCWFLGREIESPLIKRIRRADQIASGNVVTRVTQLFQAMNLSALFIDHRPLVNEARTLCYILNGLQGQTWPHISEPEKAFITFGSGLIWDGPNQRWQNLRCAVVEFTLKPGHGVRQTIGIEEGEDGIRKFFPIIQCNRFEAIDRAVKEFLTPEENIFEVVNGRVRKDPVVRLPHRAAGSPAILETLDAHLITGSKRAKEKDGSLGDYIDKVENHFLLADTYAVLAEMFGGPSTFQASTRAAGFIRQSERAELKRKRTAMA